MSLAILQWFILLSQMLCFTLSQVDASCPLGFQQVTDKVCMYFELDKKVNFCEANEACYRLGRERGLRTFLVGKHTDYLRDYMPNRRVWTSVNCLLEKRYLDRSGWRVGDAHETDFRTTNDTIAWRPHEPWKGIEYVVESTPLGMNNIAQKSTPKQYACEIASGDSNVNHATKIETIPFRVDDEIYFFEHQNHTGCFLSTMETSAAGCAFK